MINYNGMKHGIRQPQCFKLLFYTSKVD